MNDQMPPYLNPPRSRYSWLVLPAIAVAVALIAIGGVLIGQGTSPTPACQQTRTWQ